MPYFCCRNAQMIRSHSSAFIEAENVRVVGERLIRALCQRANHSPVPIMFLTHVNIVLYSKPHAYNL